MFYKIKIPTPPVNLISNVKDIAFTKPINYNALNFHKNIQPSYINIAPGLFFIDEDINNKMQYLYQNIFTDNFVSTIGIIHNISNTPSMYPPHSDKFRRVGLNFYIDLGGENVETVFYDKVDDTEDSIGGNSIPYDQLSKDNIEKIQFEKNIWYLLHTRRFHSVVNIQTSRCLLTISFLDINYKDFIVKYKNLLY